MPKTVPFNLEELDTICTIGKTVTVPKGKKGYWHVFTDAMDEWFSLDQEPEAEAQFNTWAEETGSARLYLEIEDETGETELEECWQAVGEYPL